MFDAWKQRREAKKRQLDVEIKEAEYAARQYELALKTLDDVNEASNTIIDEDRLNGWYLLGDENRGFSATEQKDMLTSAWNLYHNNPHARAIVRNLVKFTLGKGPVVTPTGDEVKLKEREKAWKEFKKDNKFNRREKEIATRTFREGETFLRKYKDLTEGKLKIRFIRPFHIAEPVGGREIPNASQGIVTDKDDIEEVKSYIRCDKDGNYKETIPAEEVIHIKILADSDMKRGISIYRVCAKRLKQYEEWLEYRIKLNKVRTAIALVRKVDSSAQHIKTIRDQNLSDRISTTRRKQKALEGGTVLTASKGIDYEMLSPNIHAQDAVDDGKNILYTIASSVGFPEMVLTADYCSDMKTEVLTEFGFMSSVEAYHRQCKLGTVREKTGQLEYQKPTDWVFSDYSGKMYLHEGRKINFCVSKNHHMWLRSESVHKLPIYKEDRSVNGFVKCTLGDTSHNGWRTKVATVRNIIEPTDVFMGDDRIFIKRYEYNSRNKLQFDGTVRDRDRYISLQDIVEFVGWMVTEGCVGKKLGYMNVCQTLDKKEYVKEIDTLLNRMPVEFHSKDYSNLGLGNKPCRYWRTDDRALAGWLRVNCGVGARNKRLPNFVWGLSIELKQKLLDTLIKGDGTICRKETGYKRFYSFSNYLINDVQRLAFELGYHTTSRRCIENQSGYVDISSGHNCMVLRENIKELRYSGKIWCATVPNGLLVTRREGRILVSGNSNANYSSTLIAQNPFVREIEDWQDYFTSLYEELYEEVIKTKIEAGKLPDNTSTECRVEFPPMVQAELEKMVKAYEILFKYKIISKKTMQMKFGLDPEVESANIEGEEGNELYGPATPGQPGGPSPFNLPLSPTNQFGSLREALKMLVEALREEDNNKLTRAMELIEEIEESASD